jgi:hypothetical protein
VAQQVGRLQETLHEDVSLPMSHQLHGLCSGFRFRGRVDEPAAREVDASRAGRFFDLAAIPDKHGPGEFYLPRRLERLEGGGIRGLGDHIPGGACGPGRVDDVREGVHGS